jgi:hypothetical protein
MENSGPILLSQNVTPPVFDVFYLHKGFSYFNDIVIQFFQKMSIMTVATLDIHETVKPTQHIAFRLTVRRYKRL